MIEDIDLLDRYLGGIIEMFILNILLINYTEIVDFQVTFENVSMQHILDSKLK